MIIIADSGSTKSDWMAVSASGTKTIKTMGFNPVFHTSDLIYDKLTEVFAGELDASQATSIYYYGSGCWDARRKAVIANALRRIFSRAEIEVQHDLLGAARASCGNDPGIACILGTGSNSCLYDGKEVIDNVINLGYLLGDEGSGTFLGKRLIQAYFYREMPAELTRYFEVLVPGGKSEILDKVYGKETPNVYLASFSKFLSDHLAHPFVQKLVYSSMEVFIDRHVRKYEGHLSIPVHFIGSIAYHFQHIMTAVLEERSMTVGNFVQKPIEELAKFHAPTIVI